MCIIFFSYQNHPHFPLIVAANRDEYYKRPTSQAEFWEDHPNILAGRDLEQMGTWMVITRTGRFAALTNYRDPLQNNPGKITRGELVSRFLNGKELPQEYLSKVQAESERYNGFNLLVGDHVQLYYFSSQSKVIEKLQPGIYGLSNAELNTPWPKVRKGRKKIQEMMVEDEISVEALFQLLTNNELAIDEELPDTGVEKARERILSPIFIQAEDIGYGTRSSTVLCMNTKGHVMFKERTYKWSGQQYQQVEYSFNTQAKIRKNYTK